MAVQQLVGYRIRVRAWFRWVERDGLEPDERFDAVADLVRAAVAPQYVTPGGPVRARFDFWDFGGAGIYRVRCSGIRFDRTVKQVRGAPSPVLAVAVCEDGVSQRECDGAQEVFRAGRLVVMDFNLPYQLGWRELGAYTALMVPLDQLALPRSAPAVYGHRPVRSFRWCPAISRC